MSVSVLIIDDEKLQVQNLEKAIHQQLNSHAYTLTAHEEEDILYKIEYNYYDVAIVDLRMSNFKMNGFDFIQRIKTVNPFAKVIVVSAYTTEYIKELNEIIKQKNIRAVIEKKSFKEFSKEIIAEITKISEELSNETDLTKKSLLDYYAMVKNENDTYKKGRAFENFVSMLFSQIGFNRIFSRVIDKSRNEVDIVIRNEMNDVFLQKFKQYIFIECKNYPKDNIGKNVLIEFKSKLENSNGLSNLGILITSGYIADTTYREAMRDSKGDFKIIFISNPQIEKLIYADNRLEMFKNIIDEQVKDN